MAEPTVSDWDVAVQYDTAVRQAAETVANRLACEGRIQTVTREEYERAVEREVEILMDLWEEECVQGSRSACDTVYANTLDSAYEEAIQALDHDLEEEWDRLQEKWSSRRPTSTGNTAIITIVPLQDLYDESEIACGRRRLGKTVPFARMPCVVLCDGRLSVPAKVLYAGSQWFTNKRGETFVGQVRLASDLGWSKRKVGRYMRELREASLIEVTRRLDSSSIITFLPLTSRYTPSEIDCLLSDEPVAARFHQLVHEHLTEPEVSHT
ncbi:MAG: hypothetical protein ACYSU0_02070 [Planctomycetota bacterium]|jgi:hypothetical protein